MFHKILVAIDTSEMGRFIFGEALELAAATNAQMMLLHVLSPFEQGYPELPTFPGIDAYYPSLYDPALHEEIAQEYSRRLEAFAQESLEMLRERADSATAEGITVEIVQHAGDPGHNICKVAESWGADVIVLGRRGRTGFSELVLGSVSNYVLHHAPCSVLTLQGRKRPAQGAAPAKEVAAN